MTETNARLNMWQTRLSAAEAAYGDELAHFDEQEAQYNGAREIVPMVEYETMHTASHVRNLSAELIEAQVNSSIPQPKVTARRKKDEGLAKVIESMIRNELDRLPMERINDLLERLVPIHGGAGILVEWDSAQRTHTTLGEVAVRALHPRQIIPQPGVTESIEAADYVFVLIPQTRESIRQRYGVDVSDEAETEPEARGTDADESADMVTQVVAYYRNDAGGIGKYSWVGDTELEDYVDYQARIRRRCKKCGAPEPEDAEGRETTPHPPAEPAPSPQGEGQGPEERTDAGAEGDGRAATQGRPYGERRKRTRKVCPVCGGSVWEETPDDEEEIWTPIPRGHGLESIPGAQPVMVPGAGVDPVTGAPVMGVTLAPTRIPAYKPGRYPVVLLKNISAFGKFLGDSDLDKIADQQRTANRIESKIVDKLIKSGSYVTLPDDASIRVDTEDMKIIRPGTHANKELIGVYTVQGDISQDMEYLSQVYEEARQIIGVTDSFQGRRDTTATSGKAKEFAAAQSAGRLESKRTMKDAAYAELFEAIFRYRLAYADEPRPIVSTDTHGAAVYDEFNRYDFLERDAAGEWYWNDQFLFSCDTSAPLASNREAMWQETRLNLQTGAFGDPASINTLILFWTKMSMLHYPGAEDTLDYLKEGQQRQMIMQAQKMQIQQEAAARQEMMRRAQMAQQERQGNMAIQQARQDARAEALADKSRQINAGRG